jgi:hypothetical protein
MRYNTRYTTFEKILKRCSAFDDLSSSPSSHLACGEIGQVAPEPSRAHLAHCVGTNGPGPSGFHTLTNITRFVRLAEGQVTGVAEFPGRARLARRVGTNGAAPSGFHTLTNITSFVRLAGGQVTGVAEFPGRARLTLVVRGRCCRDLQARPDCTRTHRNTRIEPRRVAERETRNTRSARRVAVAVARDTKALARPTRVMRDTRQIVGGYRVKPGLADLANRG